MGAEGFQVVCKVAYSTVVKPTFLLALRLIGMILPIGGGRARETEEFHLTPNLD